MRTRYAFFLPWTLLLPVACGDDDGTKADTAADTSADTAPDTSADTAPDTSADTAPDTSAETTAADTSPGDSTAREPDWSCLGNVVGDPPVADTLDLSLRIVDFISRQPVAGVAIKVCAAADACATPLAELVTDAAGEATPTLPVRPSGFRGWAELTHPDYVSMILQANVPITDGPPTLPLLGILVKNSDLPMLATLLGTELDPTRGHLNVPTWDCSERPASGVSLTVSEADASSTRFYLASGLPSTDATETDTLGAGGYVNLPAGTIHVRTTVGGDFAGAGTTEIRAGWLTSFIMLPTPEPE